MRMYDVKNGRRFDKTHPMWATYMTNKDGSIKQRMDYRKTAELESLGLIQLVPSTTEIAKIADSAGAFGAGAKWGMEIGVDSAIIAYQENKDAWKAIAVDMAQSTMNKPRDTGSDLHDAFHRIRTGELSDPTDDQKRMHETCLRVLEQLGIPLDGLETEVEFALDSHGGTADVVHRGAQVGLDWKTVQKPRQSKVSEYFQLGGYQKKFLFDHAFIVYIVQGNFSFSIKEVAGRTLERSIEGFDQCLMTWRAIKNMEAAMK